MPEYYNGIMKLIKEIADFLFPKTSAEAALENLSAHSLRERYAPSDILAGYALFSYRDPLIRSLIWQMKRGDRHAMSLFVPFLEEVIQSIAEDARLLYGRPVLVVPIPLHPKRERERGGNQVSILLDMLPRSSLWRLREILRRTRYTRPQRGLPRFLRMHNVKGSMEAGRVDADTLYILVDDVVTTGSTLKEGVRALKEKGAEHIHTIALAGV